MGSLQVVIVVTFGPAAEMYLFKNATMCWVYVGYIEHKNCDSSTWDMYIF